MGPTFPRWGDLPLRQCRHYHRLAPPVTIMRIASPRIDEDPSQIQAPVQLHQESSKSPTGWTTNSPAPASSSSMPSVTSTPYPFSLSSSLPPTLTSSPPSPRLHLRPIRILILGGGANVPAPQFEWKAPPPPEETASTGIIPRRQPRIQDPNFIYY